MLMYNLLIKSSNVSLCDAQKSFISVVVIFELPRSEFLVSATPFPILHPSHLMELRSLICTIQQDKTKYSSVYLHYATH